jgi:hypothetical protein
MCHILLQKIDTWKISKYINIRRIYMMSVPLDVPVIVVPATEPVTTNSFKVVYIEESYGWESEESDNNNPIRYRHNRGEVVADVVLSDDPYIERRIKVWEGDEYLAVRGIWSDQTLYARIKEILQAG